MPDYLQLYSKIFSINKYNFDNLALEVFEYQYLHNPIYRKFVNYLNKKDSVKDIYSIPFMPVEFFKNHIVLSDEFKPIDFFESSGTTGSMPSRHYFENLKYYESSYLLGFEQQYGNPSDWVILGLLPSYLERQHASLVYMVQGLMEKSGNPENGFYLYNYASLYQKLKRLTTQNQKVLLFGVTFALLDFADQYSGDFDHITIIETGGMKGRGRELTREEVHSILHKKLNTKNIHSEYGMTEMFSQAYSTHSGVFYSSPTMKVLKRNPYDPFDVQSSEGRGNINVIDLSNLHSCAFIATMDIAEFQSDNGFEVLGRSDYSDIRGCNLMFE